MDTPTQMIIVAVVLIGLLIGMSIYYFASSCEEQDCNTIINRMSYSEAVDELKTLVKKSPENKDEFIDNFFAQLKQVCVTQTG